MASRCSRLQTAMPLSRTVCHRVAVWSSLSQMRAQTGTVRMMQTLNTDSCHPKRYSQHLTHTRSERPSVNCNRTLSLTSLAPNAKLEPSLHSSSSLTEPKARAHLEADAKPNPRLALTPGLTPPSHMSLRATVELSLS